ncbi:hypothetical protein [Companilactobacillus sp.]|jgi:hypothetical protein|uniref:hypothetical protein n=1 Tax=Companilactobacillus sp. TaxID=2767905 RepID=UPI0025B89FC7|nr:hypothetical protein [Companilactobacillus sp.]MCH4010276.1 hypothetical protein [Companilactobacillus sp.]MCH4052048.1 hypothetical protein [Companilactobacillus sp.]MCH4078218.1 hypothetical protein [Companilactobacillus sp.]MCH4126794.1 hypothetical protein [Companilactobacillus sp.]MCH4132633.1 hypothetical protein [Companilactobacillus sp.]
MKFNTKFYKKADFYFGLFFMLIIFWLVREQPFTKSWWIDLVVFLVGLFDLIRALTFRDNEQ